MYIDREGVEGEREREGEALRDTIPRVDLEAARINRADIFVIIIVVVILIDIRQ